MNKITAYITKVGVPYKSEHKLGEYWIVPVQVNEHGSLRDTRLSYGSKEDALNVEIGDKVNL